MTKILAFFLIALCVFSAASCASLSTKDSGQIVRLTSPEVCIFYPDVLPPKYRVNQEQEWQFLTTIYGGKQFEESKKGGFWKAIDTILGEPTELKPYITLPLSIAIAPQGGKFFILDGYPPQLVGGLPNGEKEYIVPRVVWIGNLLSGKGKISMERKTGQDFEGSYDLTAGEDGYLYATFPRHKKIKIFNQSLELVKTIETAFEPWSVEVRGGKIYSADQVLTQSVFVLDAATGQVLKTIGEGFQKGKRVLTNDTQIAADHREKEGGKISFFEPVDVAVDSQGDIYVAEYEGGRILRFSADGKFIAQYGRWGQGAANFLQVNAVAVDKDNRIYGLESGLRIYKEEAKFALPVKVFHDAKSFKLENCPDYCPYALWGGKTIGKIVVPNTNNLFDLLKSGSGHNFRDKKIVEEIEIPDMANPLRIVLDYNEKNIAYFQGFAAPNFKIDYLLWVCSHSGAVEMINDTFINHGKITIFGCGKALK